jgi:pimeloyl-ACP methyl ester carboxylesterase
MDDEQETGSRFQVYPKRLCRIVLVHGTWPAGFWMRPPPPPKHAPSTGRAISKRRWYERDSSFRNGMTTEFRLRELAYVFYPFVWSGRNSVYARDEAAKLIAKLLTDAFEAFPKDDFVIIAHSHGGNTALRALHYLGDQAKRVFLITMGTPFLQIHASTRMTRRLSLDSTVLGFSLALFLAGWLLQYETIATFLTGWWGTIGLLLVCAVVAEGLIFFLFNPDYFGSRWCKRPTNIAHAAFYDLRETPPARLLVLRAFDDEASLSLAAGALATRITNSLAVKILPGCLVLVGLGSVVLLVLATLFPSVNKVLWPLVTLHITALPKVSMWFGLFAFAIGVVPGLFKAVFGRELLLGAARCEISAESVPDISDGIDIITLKPHRFTDMIRRRHAIYDNDACHAAISEWIRRVVKPPISMWPYIAIDGQDWIAAHRRFFPSMEEQVPSTEVPKQNS